MELVSKFKNAKDFKKSLVSIQSGSSSKVTFLCVKIM